MVWFSGSFYFVIQIAIVLASVALQVLLTPQRQAPQRPLDPALPKPEDGKHNLKQNVPSLPVVLGKTKKAGDYILLEEKLGFAYHVVVMAGHRIEGYVQHYLHDEAVTLDGEFYVTVPEHFQTQHVFIDHRHGQPLEAAYGMLLTDLPEIWTADHRGDGLASILMRCQSVNQEDYLDVYPNQSPELSSVIEGALVYDPRTAQDPDDPDTWTYSENIALLRLHHLTQPFGFKLPMSAIYLADWEHAADVCDEVVLNRLGGSEPRYHGGFWFRYEDDPVQIGLTLDEAGELVIYERGDGTVGVHAGEFTEPDVRITIDDIISCRYDANARVSSSVLAVRGRWTDPDMVFNTVDAAIYGDPYVGDATQRSKTVDNVMVQRHNHIQRMQKLAFTRSNAPRFGAVVAFSDASSAIPYRRFVRVHYPERGMDEAVVEITQRPRLNLADMTVSFEGIVVPEALYAFEADVEEGVYNGAPDEIEAEGVPVPTGFEIEFQSEIVAAGTSSSFAVATWDHVSDALTYELRYQKADESEPIRTAMSRAGEQSIRTEVLADGVEYRFRLRAWSNGRPSDWTDWINDTPTSESTAPGQPTDLDALNVGSGLIDISWQNPNSQHLHHVKLWRNTSATFGSATLIWTDYGSANALMTYSDTGLTPSTTYFYWVEAFNASEVGSGEVGPDSASG
jgi:hypothetical protein